MSKSELIVISGTSRGIGLGLAQYFLNAGYNVIGVNRNSKEGISLCDFDNYYLHLNDLLNFDLDFFNDFIKKIIDKSKSKKVIFINNAGIIEPIGCLSNIEIAEINKSLCINFISPMLIIKILMNLHVDLRVVNITSGAANKAVVNWGMYCATKASFKMLLDTAFNSNQVIHVDPGIVDTNMQNIIRKVSIKDFPRVDQFIEFKERGKLLSINESVKKIINEISGFI